MLILVIILLILLVDCGGPTTTTITPPSCTTSIFFEDRDGDGVGVETSTLESCDPPAGFSSIAGDCDDTDPSVTPGRPDDCDGRDSDCDDLVDEDGASTPWFPDADGDGFGDADATPSTSCEQPATATPDDSDCNDADAAVFPGADETCDGVDQDCNGTVDDDPIDGIDSFADADGDGFGDENDLVIGCLGTDPAFGGDCDDADPEVFPGAPEQCNGRDDDCDAVLDNGLLTTPYYLDADSDGFGDALAPTVDACTSPPGYVGNDTDCDDSSASVFPGAPETCNQTDDDCDGIWEDELVDDDQDGWNICEGDCDDTLASVNPDQPELCDDLDNDCSGVINDPWRDAWEPNETQAAAPRVANDDETATLFPNVSGLDDQFDWFEMDTFDDSDPAFDDDFRAWARVDEIPPGVELALHLYRNNLFAETVHVASDFSWDDGVLEVENTGVWGSNDGNLHWVEVEVLSGYSCDESYRIEIGNVE